MKGRTIEEVIQLAEKAKMYARDRIIIGSTQLKNNELAEAYFQAHLVAVGEIGGRGIRDVGNEEAYEKIALNPLVNPFLARYESHISTSAKHLTGNCFELALQALDYVINHSGDDGICAEMYQITGGDHVFLVLNRGPGSNPKDPATWESNAVICDPWSNLVYPARNYLSQLKNFYRNDKKNYIEDFDPNRHSLAPFAFNTNQIRQIRTPKNLQSRFVDQSAFLVKALETYKDQLEIEKQRLLKKYGPNDKKVLIIFSKIIDTQISILNVEGTVELVRIKKYKNDYQFAKSDLTRTLQKIYTDAVHSMQFTEDEKYQLFEHKEKKAVMELFSIKSETESNLDQITNHVEKLIKKRI
jgi:hypothetical protein